MDVLSGYEARAAAPLHDIAVMLGLPGKSGLSGKDVWREYQAGRIEEIRNYCETDVINTYLVFLRFQLLRGRLTGDGLAAEEARLAAVLEAEGRPHLQTFVDEWRTASKQRCP
jgi:predicted PolB exonuclease-like 3'-5' exonuclease